MMTTPSSELVFRARTIAWNFYISRRRKNSSFLRQEQFVHSKQQKRKTATPTVARTANALS
jgi:hypothetical protein